MKQVLYSLKVVLTFACLILLANSSFAQLSDNTIKYQLTYDLTTGRYTVWVVPDYNTPNANNPIDSAFGATAQVTIRVPKDFAILPGSVADSAGNWSADPPRLNGSDFAGANADSSYYVFGKAAVETNYGPFRTGQPVALFSFLGNSCIGQIGILAKGDSFVSIASESSLNVEPSFYSRSGQPGYDNNTTTGGNQEPLEQFIDKLGPDPECRLPIANRDDASGTYASPIVIPNVLANDTDKLNQPAVNGTNVVLNTTLIDGPNPAKGSAVLLSSGELTYTPVGGFTGTDTLVYQICDIDYPANCDTALVVITVLPAIDAFNDTLGIVASTDSIFAYPILGNDTLNGLTPTASQVAISVVDAAGKGTVTINNTNGTLTYVPNPGFSGEDSLRYKICDVANPTVCDSAWVFVTITPVIVASYDNAGTVASGDSLTYPLLTNDTLNKVGNFDPTLVNITITESPNKGTASINPTTGQVTYKPTPGFSGADSLVYQICDVLNPTVCDTALVVFNIAPVILASYDNLGTVASGDSIVNFAILANDSLNKVSPVDPALVNITITESPNKGTASINLTTGQLTYKPSPGFSGLDSLVYQICDVLNPTVCDTALVVVNIAPVIVASYDNAGTVASGDSLTYPLLTNDTLNKVGNFDPTLVNITITESPNKGTASINPTTGQVTYKPTPGFSGADSLVYQICDVLNPTVCDTALVVFNIAPVILASYDNLGTVASGDSIVNFAILSNDSLNKVSPVDPALVNITITESPNKGTASINLTTGQLTYKPSPGFSGLDSLVYQICDVLNPTVCDTALVVVNIAPVIVASYDNLGVLVADSSITYAILLNDSLNKVSPIDTSLVNVTLTTNGTKGVGTINANGTLTYVANTGASGVDSLIYTICDKINPTVCDTALVVVRIEDPLLLYAKVYLQGSLFGVTYSSGTTVDSLMRDDLRTKFLPSTTTRLIPLTSPYSYWNPTITDSLITASVLLDQAAVRDNIVDWVFVELRDQADSTKIITSRSALLQRDGDIVSLDGTSPLEVRALDNTPYYVAVRHRNHLAVMTASAIPMSKTGTTVDFRDSTATPTYKFGPQAIHRSQVNVLQGKAMWAGNALRDSVIIYQGTKNDVNVISQQVLSAPGNTFSLPFYTLRGYYNGDINMNGSVIFQGTQNDVEFIYQNIIKNHPGNGFKDNNFIIKEQLPKQLP